LTWEPLQLLCPLITLKNTGTRLFELSRNQSNAFGRVADFISIYPFPTT
jgi:hypothetical protein